MKKSKKIIVLSACIVALLATSVFGTMAYLTDQAQVVNTFTVGQVQIKVDEATVNQQGQPVKEENGNSTVVEKLEDATRTEEGNNYRLIPGATYSKDPTMTVLEGSESSYVRMLMTVHNASAVQAIIDNPVHELTDYADLFSGWVDTEWLYEGFVHDEAANTITFEFRYKEAVDGYDTEGSAADQKLPALFTSLVVPTTVTSEELAALYGDASTAEDDFKITVVGHAVQAAGFVEGPNPENPEETMLAVDAAWAAFDGQNQTNTP